MLDQSSISSSRYGSQAGSVEELHAPILVPAVGGFALGITIGVALGVLLRSRDLLLVVSRDLGTVR
jgi:hypothetical protein